MNISNPEFQISTFKPLAFSKKYFKDKKQIKDHIHKCVKFTNDYREKNDQLPLTNNEIMDGCRIIKISYERNENVLSLLGEEMDITMKKVEMMEPEENDSTGTA